MQWSPMITLCCSGARSPGAVWTAQEGSRSAKLHVHLNRSGSSHTQSFATASGMDGGQARSCSSQHSLADVTNQVLKDINI